MMKVCQESVSVRIAVGGEEIIRNLSDAWQRLCDRTSCPPFYRPEWVATYVRVFEPRSQIVLLTAWTGDELAAVLPLARRRSWFAGVPLATLSAPANVHSVRFDILREPGPAGDVAIAALWDKLKQTSGWDMVELSTFLDNGACHQLIQSASADGFDTLTSVRNNGPVLRMQGDGNGRLTWLAGTSRHFRHELRRYARLLEEQMGGTPELIRRTEFEPEIVSKFFALEASGWKGERGSAIDCRAETAEFYQGIACETAKRGCFCLHTLELNGRVAAGAFSIVTDRCFYPLKIAYDETLNRAAPGQLLINGILEECAKNNIPEVYFGGNVERFKTAWTSEILPHFNGYIFSRALMARLAFRIKISLLARLGRLRNRISRPQL
jgi:CelD/BcsL family acetyltransferase involved in cellulose biosynthesis